MKLGYEHQIVNYSKTFKDPVTKAHTHTVEGEICKFITNNSKLINSLVVIRFVALG